MKDLANVAYQVPEPPTAYGYGPRPGDPLACSDSPSIAGELGLTDKAIEFLFDSISELESKVDSMLVPQPEKTASLMGIAQPPLPPLPPMLEQMRGQRHRVHMATERVRALIQQIAV